jgi:hypothetical protein
MWMLLLLVLVVSLSSIVIAEDLACYDYCYGGCELGYCCYSTYGGTPNSGSCMSQDGSCPSQASMTLASCPETDIPTQENACGTLPSNEVCMIGQEMQFEWTGDAACEGKGVCSKTKYTSGGTDWASDYDCEKFYYYGEDIPIGENTILKAICGSEKEENPCNDLASNKVCVPSSQSPTSSTGNNLCIEAGKGDCLSTHLETIEAYAPGNCEIDWSGGPFIAVCETNSQPPILGGSCGELESNEVCMFNQNDVGHYTGESACLEQGLECLTVKSSAGEKECAYNWQINTLPVTYAIAVCGNCEDNCDLEECWTDSDCHEEPCDDDGNVVVWGYHKNVIEEYTNGNIPYYYDCIKSDQCTLNPDYDQVKNPDESPYPIYGGPDSSLCQNNNWYYCQMQNPENNQLIKVKKELSISEKMYCTGTEWIPVEENCSNGGENDGGYPGLIDCLDPTCDKRIGGPENQTCEFGKELTCDDGFNNDDDEDLPSGVCDSSVEYQEYLCCEADSDCDWDSELCMNNMCLDTVPSENDDPDQFCLDLNYHEVKEFEDGNVVCIYDEVDKLCNDGIDNDFNGKIDSEDTFCPESGTGPLMNSVSIINGGIDCRDSDCYLENKTGPNKAECCLTTADCSLGAICGQDNECHETVCDVDVDNDKDNLTRCEDSDCDTKKCGGTITWPMVCSKGECKNLATPGLAPTETIITETIFSYNDILAILHDGVVFKEEEGICDEICKSKSQTCIFADGGRKMCAEEGSTRCTCR